MTSLKTKRKLKEYLDKGVRKIKNRKGYGVHSPFAFAIITEVIEEKSLYYSYHAMRNLYDKQAPIPLKVATLLFRLSNRFGCRNVLEVNCDGGYSALPFLLVDSRNTVCSVASKDMAERMKAFIDVEHDGKGCLQTIDDIAQLPEDYRPDMVVINGLPHGMTNQQLFDWLMSHAKEHTLFFIKGIRMNQQHESLWDAFCDSDEVPITMDMYDFGLVILRPRFFKQHYIVSF